MPSSGRSIMRGRGVLIQSRSRELHPLLNPLILKTVFRFLSPSAYKTARRVCKIWWLELLPLFRDLMQLEFQVIDEYDDVSHRRTPTELMEHLVSIHPTVTQSDPYLLRQYLYKNIVFRKDIPVAPQQTIFWELFGVSLKRLELTRHVRIQSSEFFRKLLFELTPNLEEFTYRNCILEEMEIIRNVLEYEQPVKVQSNLKTITIRLNSSHGYEYPVQFPVSWMELFSKIPNVKEVNLYFFLLMVDNWGEEVFAEIIKTIGAIRQATQNETLNITQFNTSPPTETPIPGKLQLPELGDPGKVALFCSLSLPLSNVHLGVTDYEDEEHHMGAFLQCHANTLKSLCFERLVYEDEEHDPLQQFQYETIPPSLTKLGLIGTLFPTLGFLAFTPNLTELTLNQIDMDEMKVIEDIQQRNIAPLVHLKKFELNYDDDEIVDVDLLQILTALMPNVTHINLRVDADGFECISSGWQLEEMVVGWSRFAELKCIPYVALLTCLKSIEIKSGDELTYDAFIHELIKLPQLTKVSGVVSQQVSKKAMKTLKKKIANTDGVRRSDQNHTSKAAVIKILAENIQRVLNDFESSACGSEDGVFMDPYGHF